jgi:hypothetical protein
MIKIQWSCLYMGLALVPFSLSAEVRKSAGAPTLPPSIRATLDQEYPGWMPAPVTPQIHMTYTQRKAAHSPSFAAGDFNHDGKRDYAVQIVLKTPGQEEQIIIVFLARGDGFEEIILQSMGIDPTSSLWVTRTTIDETGANPNKTVSSDVLMVLGGAAGDTTYAYDDGKFHEIPAPDDPEHPDPSIPRVPPQADQPAEQAQP